MTNVYSLKLHNDLTVNNFRLFNNFKRSGYIELINKTDEREIYSLYSFDKNGKEKVKISNLEIHFDDGALLKNANIYLNNFTENGKKWLSSVSDNLAFIHVYIEDADSFTNESIKRIEKQPIGILQKFEIEF